MKAVVTAQEMAQFDRLTMELYGIPGMVLMENAGRGVAEVVLRTLGDPVNKRVQIYCGPGNNGGDGYVIARYLINRGAQVSLFLLADPAKISGDAFFHLNILSKLGCRPVTVKTAADLPTERPDVIVDALLGTGVRGPLRPLYEKTVEHINRQQAPALAVDIPTGVNADTGAIVETAVRAQVTATMALLKRGLLFSPGREYCGRIEIVDISMPTLLVTEHHPRVYYVQADDVRRMLPQRPLNAHKNQCGQVTVVAGSRGFTGAAALVSEVALRVGSGLVYLLTPQDLNAIYEQKLTEVITLPTIDAEGFLTDSALPMIVEHASVHAALAVGPGLGRRPATEALVRGLLQALDKPLVLDADGLNACVGHTHLLRNYKGALILTPHVGELARLTGLTAADITADPVDIARRFAQEWDCTLALKGGPTVTAAPDGRVYINSTGNAGMATAGTGDVLTGIIAGLLAQGLETTTACTAGVYIHGSAGDWAAQSLGTLGMIAGDVLKQTPPALRHLQEPT